MVKAGFPEKKIDGGYSALREMASLGFMEAVPVGEVVDGAKEAAVAIRLHASDSVYLATALKRDETLVTEDRHLLAKDVREYAGKEGVGVVSLREMGQQ